MSILRQLISQTIDCHLDLTDKYKQIKIASNNDMEEKDRHEGQ
jgi:hypothetical protein